MVALMHSLIKNHPFADGSTRTVLMAAAIFLELNGHPLTASNEAALAFTQQAAAGGMEVAELAEWLQAHSRPAVDRP